MSETHTGDHIRPEADVPRLKLERRRDGQIWAVREGSEDVAVRVQPCFPWTHTRRYVSVRDADDNELALVADLGELDEGVRGLIEEALAEIGFVLEITRLDSLETEFEIRNWKVETRQGPFTFQTKLDDWPHPLPGGGLLIRDVAGNLFRIADPHALNAHSRKLLHPFVD
jgi:hypothetical protein